MLFVRDKNFYKRLFALALPMALQNIVTFSVGLFDNLMVGTLGEHALGGVYIANQLQNILHMMVLGFGGALVVLAAQYYGKNDIDRVKTIISIVFKLALLVGLLFTAGVWLFGTQIFGLFTDEPAVLAQTIAYARYASLGYVFFCAANTLLASMRCVGTVKIGLYVSVSTLFLDTFLNWVMIFGRLGFPAMGVEGAALSTTVARAIELCIVAFYVLRVDRKLQLRIRDIRLFSTDLAMRILRYGGPVILGDVLWGIGGAAQTAILGRLSADVLSAGAVANNLHQIFSVLVYGVASASGVIIGQTVGRGEYSLVRSYAKTLQLVFLGVGLVSGAILFSGRGVVNILYAHLEPSTRAYAMQFLTVMSVTLIGTSYQMSVLTGVVRAGGSTHFVLVNDLVFVWLVVIPSAAIAAFVFGAPAWVVFACLKCDQILKCAVAFFKVNYFGFVRNLTQDKAVSVSEHADASA